MLKLYKPRYVRSYAYADPETGDSEEIIFMANGYLMPLFKSYTGVDLGRALDDYRKGLASGIDEKTLKVIGEYETADNDGKLRIVADNSDVFLRALEAAQARDDIGGMSLFEALMITMRVCALPLEDQAAAFAAGIEILPQECYEDIGLVLDLLNLAIAYNDHAKKNAKYQKQR